MKSGKNAKYEKAFFNNGIGNSDNSRAFEHFNWNTGVTVYNKDVNNEATKKSNKLAKNVCRKSRKN